MIIQITFALIILLIGSSGLLILKGFRAMTKGRYQLNYGRDELGRLMIWMGSIQLMIWITLLIIVRNTILG